MIDNVLDGVVACSDVFGSHGRVRLQKRHVVATVQRDIQREHTEREHREGRGEGTHKRIYKEDAKR